MRSIAGIALALTAALAIAGCTDPAPEPTPTSSATPSPPGPTPTTAPGTGNGGSSGNGGNGGNGFAPQQHHDEATAPSKPGLVVFGDMRACDQGYCVNATAINNGTQTYHYDSMCVPAWREGMSRDEEQMQHREPMFYCAAFGTTPLAPGASVSYETAWNGTLWDDGSQSYMQAPPDMYVWSISFVAYDQADGEGGEAIDLDFPVFTGPS